MNNKERSLISKIITDDIIKEYRYILIGYGLGILVKIILLQVLKYFQRHPEFLNSQQPNQSILKDEKPVSRKWVVKKLRGGLLEILSGLAKIIDGIPAAGAIIGLLSLNEDLTSIIYNNSPQNFPIKTLRSVDQSKDARNMVEWLCDTNLKYLFNVLLDTSIPYEKKEVLVSKLLSEELNLKTDIAWVLFVQCIASIMIAIYIPTPGSYQILSNTLAEAVEKGKMKKNILRGILSRLKGKDLRIEHRLFEVLKPDESEQPEKINPLSMIWIIKKLRGGWIHQPETLISLEREKFLFTMDPIFVLIHLQKARFALEKISSKLNPKSRFKRIVEKLVQNLQNPFDRKFLVHLVFAFLALSAGDITVRSPRNLVPEQKAHSMSSTKKISEISDQETDRSSILIQAGDKLLTIASSSKKNRREPSKPAEKSTLSARWQERLARKKQTKRGIERRLSDLPPLSDSDFSEILTESNSGSKIRIRTKGD